MNPRKLTDAQVLAIRSSVYSQTALAAQYGVSAATISKIQRGEHYRDAPWPAERPQRPQDRKCWPPSRPVGQQAPQAGQGPASDNLQTGERQL